MPTLDTLLAAILTPVLAVVVFSVVGCLLWRLSFVETVPATPGPLMTGSTVRRAVVIDSVRSVYRDIERQPESAEDEFGRLPECAVDADGGTARSDGSRTFMNGWLGLDHSLGRRQQMHLVPAPLHRTGDGQAAGGEKGEDGMSMSLLSTAAEEKRVLSVAEQGAKRGRVYCAGKKYNARGRKRVR